MKKSLRIASAALALTLAASCAVPAFAAGSSSFSKDETVYAVMNGDGSLKSTTVSEHLYNAGGLSSVTDKSTLTDIQNTESSAEFTQNGDELVWNTDDTDVPKEESVVISDGRYAAEVLADGFDTHPAEDGSWTLPGVVSRKKQFIPALMTAYQEL